MLDSEASDNYTHSLSKNVHIGAHAVYECPRISRGWYASSRYLTSCSVSATSNAPTRDNRVSLSYFLRGFVPKTFM